MLVTSALVQQVLVGITSAALYVATTAVQLRFSTNGGEETGGYADVTSGG